MWIALGATAAVILLWWVITFNSIRMVQNHVRESWSNVDTELKRRYELIPNLVATVKGYAAHEKDVLERVAELRTRAVASTGSAGSQARDENELIRGLRNLVALVERYPQLKADAQFGRLIEELRDTEDRIQAARRFYNSNVRMLNNAVQTIPSSIVARMIGATSGEFFEVEELAVRAAPRVG